ncbi:putative serine esterase [Fusarium oxysporum f. sp. rapae]|uniref:Putative serine esterase n=1 Tax=Fusarium oxysporum f. sp. rapae TaxID=485398 RepID=A0A8J5P665_FUSOX|nr:putative serine esterase [Fusarium oxysporum f. sp. rapae]
MASHTINRSSAGPRIQDQFPEAIINKIPVPSEHPHYNYDGFNPSRKVLEVGYVKAPGRRAFGVKTIYDRDQAITVRDGARLYADIFRPETSESKPVPAILPWSPYGKSGTGTQGYDSMAPFRAGLALDRTSGYEKFEAPDPAEWAERDYAVINIDARGVGHSEGVITFWGNQEAEDIYDVIDWISRQPWCNGSVVMAGNSWLAVAQVNFASRLHHFALKAIAPWESFTDPYRQFAARGGRPHIPTFHKLISGGFAGPEGAEDVFAMLQKYPLYNDYWEAKRIPVEKIDNIPMYVLASYSSMLHTYGSLQTFRMAKTERKWLRVHPYQEWYDLYRPEISDELQRYFDAYSKPESPITPKDWEESTPRVRLSLIGFESDGSPAKTVLERPEKSYPLERQKLTTLYLDAESGKLGKDKPGQETMKSYKGKSLTDQLTFTTTFNTTTELAGYPKAVLYMSCPDHDDFDVAVQIRKIDPKGRQLAHLNYPCPAPIQQVPDVNIVKTLGPQGFLRASHHVSLNGEGGPTSSNDLSHQTDVLYSHRIREPIKPGTVVGLEIPIWPIGMVFEAGEGIALNVSGHDMCLPETDLCRVTGPEDENIGRHFLHTGGKYDSHLIIPVIKGSV